MRRSLLWRLPILAGIALVAVIVAAGVALLVRAYDMGAVLQGGAVLP